MEEKDKSQQGQELLEVDEKAKDKKKTRKKASKEIRNFHSYSPNFPLLSFIRSLSQNFHF